MFWTTFIIWTKKKDIIFFSMSFAHAYFALALSGAKGQLVTIFFGSVKYRENTRKAKRT